MPIATNDAGEVLFLNEAGEWGKARVAENPETGQRMAFDGKDWVTLKTPAPAAEAKAEPEMEYGLQDSILHGMTLGASQEVGAAGRAAGDYLGDMITGQDGPSFGERFSTELDTAERARQAYNSRNPWAGTGSEIAGGFLTGAPVVKGALGAASKLPNWMRATGAGAGMGATAGALENNQDRAQGAVMGGSLGAMLGLSVPIATNVIGKIGRPAWDHIVSKLGTGQHRVGLRLLAQDLARDEITPEQFLARVRDLGPEATLADAGGANVRSLAEVVAQTPGKGMQRAAETMLARQSGKSTPGGIAGGMHTRVMDATKQALGTRGNVNALMSDMMKTRKANAARLYRKAYAVDAQRLDTPQLRKIMDNPAIRDAYADAQAIARIDGRELPDIVSTTAKGATVRAKPNMETLDYIKQALDDRVSAAYRAGANKKAGALKNLRDNLKSELDRVNPAYREARQMYAGDAALEEAMESGRSFMRGDTDAVIGDFHRMTVTEKQAFREGVTRSIREMAEKPGEHINTARRIFNSPDARRRLKPLFQSEAAFNKWAKAMQRELQFFETQQQALRNSATARRQAKAADMSIDPAPLLEAVANPTSIPINAARYMGRFSKPPQEALDDLANILYTQDSSAQRKAVAELLRRTRVPNPGIDAANSLMIGGGVPAITGR